MDTESGTAKEGETMTTIYKYPLLPQPCLMTVGIPRGSKILCVQSQFGIPTLWASVDTEQPNVECRFRIVMTGQHSDDLRPDLYIGTVQLDGGTFVLHVFGQVTA